MAAPTSTLVRRADCPTLATIKLKADSKGMPCSDSSCGRLHRTKLIDFQLGPVSRESPVCVYPLKAANKDGNIAPLSLAVVIPSDPTKPDFDRYINMMKMVKELNTAPVIVDGRKVAIIKRQLFTIQDLENSSGLIATFTTQLSLTDFRLWQFQRTVTNAQGTSLMQEAS
ncbi:hypothetical protein FRB99_005035 [Tulasnella sp. 403]|nr:hypothetical protein FRB99_005035 [Tulasnella sp. 403]